MSNSSLIAAMEAEKIGTPLSIEACWHNEAIDMCCNIIRQHSAEAQQPAEEESKTGIEQVNNIPLENNHPPIQKYDFRWSVAHEISLQCEGEYNPDKCADIVMELLKEQGIIIV